MNNLYVALIVIFIQAQTFAQVVDTTINNSQYSPQLFAASGLAESNANQSIQIYTDVYLGSNSLTTSFINKLQNGNFIDDELKNKIVNKLKDKNTAGYNFTTGIQYAINTDSLLPANSNLIIGVEYSTNQSVIFTSDAYEFIFKGNAGFADATAEFSESSLYSSSFLKYKAGWQKKFYFDSTSLNIGVNAGYAQGNAGRFLKVDEGEIYTAIDGSYLDITHQFNYQTAAPNAAKLFDHYGGGFVADVMGKFQFL